MVKCKVTFSKDLRGLIPYKSSYSNKEKDKIAFPFTIEIDDHYITCSLMSNESVDRDFSNEKLESLYNQTKSFLQYNAHNLDDISIFKIKKFFSFEIKEQNEIPDNFSVELKDSTIKKLLDEYEIYSDLEDKFKIVKDYLFHFNRKNLKTDKLSVIECFNTIQEIIYSSNVNIVENKKYFKEAKHLFFRDKKAFDISKSKIYMLSCPSCFNKKPNTPESIKWVY